MMPMASHGTATPEPIIVEIEGVGELEFPGDTDPSVIQAKVAELTAPKGAPGEFAKYGPMSQLMRDHAYPDQAAANFKESAPAIGAGLAVAAGPGGWIPGLALAAGGGYLGARGRGDDRTKAATEGVTQGVIEGVVGRGGMVGGIAKRIYRGAVPKAVQDKFSRSDIAGAGLDNRAVLGTKQGVTAAERAGTNAAQDVAAAAPSARPMSGTDVRQAFDAKRRTASAGRKPQRVSEIDAHVQQAMSEIGPTPMDGPAQLARKGILEGEAKPAMQAMNSNLSAVNPQMANIERKAIVSNLRRTPAIAAGLNKQQSAVGLGRAARATENSSVVNRLAHGGIWNAARSPVAFSGAGIALNEGKRVLSPQVVRLLQLIMGEQQ